MRSIRSGASSRFLIFRSPEFWAPRSELVVFNFLFGFLPMISALIGFSIVGAEAIARVFDPRDPLHRLEKPADEAERRRGVVRVGGKLRGGPVCVLVHERRGNKEWHEDWRETLGRAEIEPDGAAPIAVTWWKARWEPALTLREGPLDGVMESVATSAQLASLPPLGRLRHGCVAEGQPIFVAGCEVEAPGPHISRTIGGCAGGPLVVTPGDGTARPRIVELGASLAGRASLLGLAALIAALYLWRISGARPLADALARRLRQPHLSLVEPTGLWIAPILGPGALLLAQWLGLRFTWAATRVDVSEFAAALFAVIVGLIAAARMIDRRRLLGSIADGVQRGAAPPRGREREGELVALDAVVDPDAPRSIAPVTKRERAHWMVTITRVFKAGNNHSSEAGPEHRGPMTVPIRADGRAALLDLTHAAVDLRAVRERARGRSMRSDHASLVGAPDRASIYLFEERYLEPGEPIHVIGRVRRFEAVPGGSGTIPVIGGLPGDLAIVHAGSRRSLLRNLAIERGYLAAAIPLCLALSATVAALAAYLASR